MTQVEVPTSIGWVCVFIGIFSFGFFTTPLKLDCVIRSKVDPFIIQLYISFPVFIFSMPMAIFSDKFEISYYGIWGAAIWVPVSILSIVGVHFLGIAIAQSLWGGLSMTFSFLWGVLLFHQRMKSMGITILGLFLLVLGIVGTTLSDTDFIYLFFRMICQKIKKKMKKSRQPEHEGEKEENKNILVHEEDSEEEEIIDDDQQNSKQIQKEQYKLDEEYDDDDDEKTKFSVSGFTLGIIAVIIMSLLNGSLMVPAKFDSGNPMYFFSFGIGVLLFSSFYISIIYLLRSLFCNSYPRQRHGQEQKTIIQNLIYDHHQVKDGMIPGLLVGTMFVFGNYAQTYATFSPLGLAIGFPLVQTCMVITALNGMIFFGELENWRKKLMFFFCCFFLVIPGFFLLAIFGMS